MPAVQLAYLPAALAGLQHLQFGQAVGRQGQVVQQLLAVQPDAGAQAVGAGLLAVILVQRVQRGGAAGGQDGDILGGALHKSPLPGQKPRRSGRKSSAGS